MPMLQLLHVFLILKFCPFSLQLLTTSKSQLFSLKLLPDSILAHFRFKNFPRGENYDSDLCL